MNPSNQDMAGRAPGRVLLIAPAPPAPQGMFLQKLLREDGASVDLLGHSQPLSPQLRSLERVPVVHTLLRAVAFYLRFWNGVRNVEVVHILTARWQALASEAIVAIQNPALARQLSAILDLCRRCEWLNVRLWNSRIPENSETGPANPRLVWSTGL
jgi:hypothetical protein